MASATCRFSLPIMLACAALAVSPLAARTAAAVEIEPPSLRAGVMDMRGWAFTGDRTLPLLGEWEFYRGRLIEPGGFGGLPAEFLGSPSFWPAWSGDYPFGLGTYRGRFLVEPGRTYAMRIPNQDTAYRLYLDGELISSDGRVSDGPDGAVPARNTRTFYWTPQAAGFELVMQVSNYHHYKGGMTNRILFGLPEAVDGRREFTLMLTFLYLGGFLFMGIFFMIRTLFLREQLVNLWFALICLTFAVRSLFTVEADITLFFSDTPWIVITRGGFLTELLLLPLFVLYVNSLFARLIPPAPFAAMMAFSGLALAAVAGLVPMPFYAKYLHPVVLYAFYLGNAAIFVRLLWIGFRGRREALYFAASFLVMFVLLLEPFLFYSFLPECSYESTTMGFAVFILCQAALLGRRVGEAFRKLDFLATNLERQVAERTGELALANQALRSKNSERDFFLMSLSHEVRTPMTIILNYIKRLVRRYPDDGEIRIVQGNLERILGEMLNIFDFLRFERGKRVFADSVRFFPERELGHLTELYAQAAAEAGLSWSLEPGPGVAVIASVRAFHRMCGNCLENAIKYTRQGGAIRIRTQAADGVVRVAIENSGPLLSEEEIPHLFSPFYQGKAGSGGTGLGLYLVAEMARQAGGKAGFEIRDGWNSFFLELPVAAESADRPPADQSLDDGGQETPGALPADGEWQILLVDDDPDIRALMLEILHPRCLVKMARDAEEALRLLEGGLRPDVVVSDVMLPGKSGFDLVRALEGIAAVPVLLVSAMADLEDKCPKDGAVRVATLTKPFTEEELWRRLVVLVGGRDAG